MDNKQSLLGRTSRRVERGRSVCNNAICHTDIKLFFLLLVAAWMLHSKVLVRRAGIVWAGPAAADRKCLKG